MIFSIFTGQSMYFGIILFLGAANKNGYYSTSVIIENELDPGGMSNDWMPLNMGGCTARPNIMQFLNLKIQKPTFLKYVRFFVWRTLRLCDGDLFGQELWKN